jgi:tRNA uridine 5-carbamoylmethylation protein Kti12
MHKLNENSVLILTCAPGSGKTTAAQLLAAKFERSVHLESDRFFDFIQAGYMEPWRAESHTQNTTVMSIVAGAAAGYAAAGYFTIVDGIISPRWFFQPLRDSLHAFGHSVTYAGLRAPLSVCQQRVASRAPDQLPDPAVVKRLWQDFADLGPLERHCIESGTGTAAATAVTLAERLRNGLLLT